MKTGSTLYNLASLLYDVSKYETVYYSRRSLFILFAVFLNNAQGDDVYRQHFNKW